MSLDVPSQPVVRSADSARRRAQQESAAHELQRFERDHHDQLRREVLNAAHDVYRCEVKEQGEANIQYRKQQVRDLGEEKRSNARARLREATSRRVEPDLLDEDELLLDRRLHQAMETKLGRLTYLREHARVQRLFAQSRNIVRRRQLSKEREHTLSTLVSSGTPKSGGGRGGVVASPPGHVGLARASTPLQNATEQRSSDSQARDRTVSALLQRDSENSFCSGDSRHPPRDASVPPHGNPVVHRRAYGGTSSSIVAGHGDHTRPMSRPEGLADDVDWASASAARPSTRPASQEGSTQPASRLSTPGGIGDATGTKWRNRGVPRPRQLGPGSVGSSVTVGVARPSSRMGVSRVSDDANRSKLLLPPLPALLPRSGADESRTSPTRARGLHSTWPQKANVPAVVDPFPEETERAFRIMEKHTAERRRPNSRGVEERRVFEKHSMNVIRDMILGCMPKPVEDRHGLVPGDRSDAAVRRLGPEMSRRPESRDATERPAVSTASRSGQGERITASLAAAVASDIPSHGKTVVAPRTALQASRTALSSANHICPPVSNDHGELDYFERSQQRQTQSQALAWVKMFGKHRLSMEDLSAVAAEGYEVLPIPEGETYDGLADESEEEVEEEDANDDEGSLPQVAAEEKLTYEMVDMSMPPEFANVAVLPSSQQLTSLDEQRSHLQAHHGGIGGDSPQRLRGAVPLSSSDAATAATAGEGVAPTVSPGRNRSVLPKHEPDFSFEAFFAGSFETMNGGPDPQLEPGRKDEPATAAATTDAAGRATFMPPASRIVAEDEYEDDLFPAPPADARRFVDFCDSSDSTDVDDSDSYSDDTDQKETNAGGTLETGAGDATANEQSDDVGDRAAEPVPAAEDSPSNGLVEQENAAYEDEEDAFVVEDAVAPVAAGIPEPNAATSAADAVDDGSPDPRDVPPLVESNDSDLPSEAATRTTARSEDDVDLAAAHERARSAEVCATDDVDCRHATVTVGTVGGSSDSDGEALNRGAYEEGHEGIITSLLDQVLDSALLRSQESLTSS